MLRIFFIISAIILSSSLCFGETWKITSLDWQPYSGSQLTNQGNSVQKLRQLLEKRNIKLIVEFYPWKRAQMLAKSEDYVGYFPAWPEEVGEEFMASGTVDLSELGVVTSIENKSKLKYESIEDLFKNFKVGYIGSYVYPTNITSAIKKYPRNANNSPNEISLIKQISIGRLAAGLTDPNVSLFLASQEGLPNIVVMDEILEVKPLVVSFRKGDDNMMRLKLLNSLITE